MSSENSTIHPENEGKGDQESTMVPEVLVNPHLRWYAIVTQTSMERRAKSALEDRIKKHKLADKFGQIIIPTRQVERIDDKGKKKITEQRMMPGYIFLQMELNDKTYHLVKETPKVSNFLGASNTKEPPPLTNEEVDRVVNRSVYLAKELAARPKTVFERGERVKVIDGPFTNFFGDVDEVKADKMKLKLLITVFGRATPVEIEFSKVEKAVDEAIAT